MSLGFEQMKLEMLQITMSLHVQKDYRSQEKV